MRLSILTQIMPPYAGEGGIRTIREVADDLRQFHLKATSQGNKYRFNTAIRNFTHTFRLRIGSAWVNNGMVQGVF